MEDSVVVEVREAEVEVEVLKEAAVVMSGTVTELIRKARKKGMTEVEGPDSILS